jgi:ribosome biogenesis GTPase
VIDAVENGTIPKSRHDSYVRMFDEVKDIKEWQLS